MGNIFVESDVRKAQAAIKLMHQIGQTVTGVVSEHADMIGVPPQQLADCAAVDIYRSLVLAEAIEAEVAANFSIPTDDAPKPIRDAIDAIEAVCVEGAKAAHGADLQIVRKFVATHLAMTVAQTYLGVEIQRSVDAALERSAKITESN